MVERKLEGVRVRKSNFPAALLPPSASFCTLASLTEMTAISLMAKKALVAISTNKMAILRKRLLSESISAPFP